MAWGKSNASKIKPGEVAAAWRRSLRASVAEDWASAETWLERIVEADSSDLDAYHALARLYRRQGAIGRAIRMHQNLMLRTDLPKEARGEALFELARDFEEGGFTERAAASYEELIDSQPRHAESLERLVPLPETHSSLPVSVTDTLLTRARGFARWASAASATAPGTAPTRRRRAGFHMTEEDTAFRLC